MQKVINLPVFEALRFGKQEKRFAVLLTNLKRRLVVQNLKMAWSRRFIPKLFVWHSSRDIVRMKWRYYRTGLYTIRSHWIFNISLQQTYLHWPVSMLEFLQPPQTENQFNRYFGTQGFHDLFKRQTWPRAWQNPFNTIGKWLSGKFK